MAITRSARGRLATWLRIGRRRSTPYLGWNPREPMCLGLAILLLFASLIMPWWGLTKETFDPRRVITRAETVQFGPWLTTHWYSSVAPGYFLIQASPMLWWDFPTQFPAYAPYTPVSALLCGLWSAAAVIGVAALWARGAPRRRFGSWPTIAEAAVGGLVAAALLVSVVEFPPVGGHASFAGTSPDGSLQWGPGLGWYVAIGIVILASAAAIIGFRVDRKLAGVCWFCFRPLTGPRCTYCGSLQRRERRQPRPGAADAVPLGSPKQKT